MLYAARHQLAAPPLARWLLALGIVATLAACGPWLVPRTSRSRGGGVARCHLVGSYELLLWLIRTAAAGAVARQPAADRADDPADDPVTGLRLVSRLIWTRRELGRT